ncbi:hypothetical protein [Paenibacillus eucommiae]|uniref:Uncharacterized protein n=1 Tax=Paenibacillus eucommiae TaxID=1355755 RepID=A0ABS4IZN1_9BACL|nr:hypothetical protein [Paenibacillus eucommiae]MBP1993042.1 hypothetical protein [Paenibacillus eucommiae]
MQRTNSAISLHDPKGNLLERWGSIRADMEHLIFLDSEQPFQRKIGR